MPTDDRPKAVPTARVRVSRAPVPGGYWVQQGARVMRRAKQETLPRFFPRVPAARYDRPKLQVGDPRTIKTKI